MYFLNGFHAVSGALISDGPFESVEEAETWAATHDLVDYTIDDDEEEIFDDLELWPEFCEWDLEYEDYWDDEFDWEEEEFVA